MSITLPLLESPGTGQTPQGTGQATPASGPPSTLPATGHQANALVWIALAMASLAGLLKLRKVGGQWPPPSSRPHDDGNLPMPNTPVE